MLAAILFALAIHYRKAIYNSKIVRGDYGLPISFWCFGLLGYITTLGTIGLYVFTKIDKSQSASGDILDAFSAMSAINTAIVVGFVLLMSIFLSVWRAAGRYKKSFILKWLARYLSIFALSTAMACLLRPTPFIFGLIIYLAIYFIFLRKFTRIKISENETPA